MAGDQSGGAGQFTLDVSDYTGLYDAFNRILKILELADTQP